MKFFKSSTYFRSHTEQGDSHLEFEKKLGVSHSVVYRYFQWALLSFQNFWTQDAFDGVYIEE